MRAQREEDQGYLIKLQPPGPQQVFKLESEASLYERIRQEGKERPSMDRIVFPDEPVVGVGPHLPRDFVQSKILVEPNYLCYDRLYFEDINSERYGWDLGVIQPFVSSGKFFWDVAALPYHFWTAPCSRYDSNAGFCLPGDPVPYLIYPPEISITGGVMEAGTIIALLAFFP
jgi:hypothetical protein